MRLSSAWEAKRNYPLGSIAVVQAKPFRSKYESSAVVTSLYDAMHDAGADINESTAPFCDAILCSKPKIYQDRLGQTKEKLKNNHAFFCRRTKRPR